MKFKFNNKSKNVVDPKAFKYDWRLDGEPAIFSVDLTLYDNAPALGFRNIAFIGCSALEAGAALNGSEIRRAAAFADKMKHMPEFIYAGYVETQYIRQYYFYLRTSREFSIIKELVQEAHGFTCRAGIKSDPDWFTYFRVLYPDNAKYQTYLNDRNISELIAAGDSEAPRRLNMHLAFKSAEDRSACSVTALSEGFALGECDEKSGEALPFTLILHRICALKKSDIDAVTVQAVRTAEQFGGKLSYWDCPIVPKRA